MKPRFQTTLRERIVLAGGIGVHSGKPVRLVLNPAEANTGLVFLRSGLPDGGSRFIEANWAKVTMTELCTVIGDGAQHMVATIEHLVAALHGMGVDNCLVEVDGPEVPIMDGSAGAFVEAIDRAGIAQLDASRRYIKILKPVRVEQGRAFAELLPADKGFRLDVEIDFKSEAIGRQRKILDLDASAFRRELARARTFGFLADVKRLVMAGFALGASLENSVGIDDDRVLNPEGLRFSDEFVRHKMLDAVGDLALAGAPILGQYRSYCGGHKLNVAALAALFADRSAYRFVEGAPAPREGARADLGLVAAPVFMPERS
ncbi:UDP-3-O-acyl-N-acetylglucosamine deacetylase [Rhodoblastus acidophilus]|uniref:UDP-3-O-acyl-N-acetylglucosamine deacetylase n=1 Tax=Candidatus Rhodoblastus alkanivorans TaxID=2954117 RepID=A0ABS9Z8F4_9HYPH|nr:UDP-3-O-acyl-N-acetylglucosamine deacetylase [Candidatus Rhodoblastus alkanivorans]MCI4679509.1 UDP-3-O-acyl-N-acetylglucosamine deacetylase [Candidatus Rhodoblastus alkanivorans]MCI4683954.1 UDP-3-O-acyl-N-acetylglucosamine deacetylase [Candidatus Rhodoblastus alkanivorans]MDI4641273.1 UDP-3-O-acyl-N-acetylglucosamine deacetylase [Rhodoblastus acidophilus]